MQSKTATGNLINRYKAVLKKCSFINFFGSLAVVGMLTLGAGAAFALEDISTTGETVNASGDTVSEIGAGAGNNYYGGFAESTNTTASESGGNAIANNNTLTITGGTASEVNGGFATSQVINTGANVGSISANGNILILDAGAVVERALGGNANTIGSNGTVDVMTANNNVVHVYGEVSASIIGGRVDSSGSISSPSEQANGNTVNIYDGATVNVVRGAYSSGYSINNTVILNGAVTFSGAGQLWGGSSGSVTDGFTGNTLRLNNYVGTKRIDNVLQFEKYAFVLPKTTQAGDAILQTDDLNLSNGKSGSELKSAYIESVSIESGHTLQVGDSVILIDANTIDGTLANDGGTVKSTTGTFVEQEWKVAQDTTENNITAELLTEKKASSAAGGVANPYSAAAGAVMGVAARTAVSVGIPAAQGAAQSAAGAAAQSSTEGQGTGMSGGSAGKSYGIAPFAVVHGGFNTYHTDSHVDVNSISFMGGIAFNKYFSQGELLLGAFFETGSASYNSYDNSGLTEIHGTGYMDYYGGGLLARYEFYGKGGKPYVEASARMGTLNTSYESDDIIDATTGYGVNYDISANYYGLHVGAGYIWQWAPQWKLDLSAKYFWTHQEGSSAHIGGNKFEFDAMNSHILRAGATLSYDVVEKESYTLSPYVGLAYEYELDGEAGATVDGLSVSDTVSSQGGTGVLNLGVNFKHVNGFSVNLGAEGSLGMRDGIMGKLEMKYEF